MYSLPESTPDLRSFQLVQSPKSARSLAMVLISVLISGLMLLIFAPWQQTSMGRGRIVAYSPTDRQQSIDAPVEGRLGRWLVHEGSQVKAGDSIVEIVDNDPEILNRLNIEKEALTSRLNAAKASIQIAKINLERQKILAQQGLSSQRSYELAKLEMTKFSTDVANAQAEIARIDVRLARQATQSVKAPRDGTILRRIAGEGSVLVKAGTSLAILVPNTDSRAVELWIDGNDVSLMKEGREVRLQFEGWPAIQFSGWPSVAVGTFGGKVALIDAADNGNGKFRTLVVPNGTEPWPSSDYLRQGIRAHGWILLGRVRLGYELWRQFNGFPPAIAYEPASSSSAKGIE